MLRKHTTFFDTSLSKVERNTTDFVALVEVRDRLLRLVEGVSVFGWYRDKTESDRNDSLQAGLADIVGGEAAYFRIIPGFYTAVTAVHRLEFVFTYPLEEKPTNADAKLDQRRFELATNFFWKGKREPFYKIIFWVSPASGLVWDKYWGVWPQVKSPVAV